MAAVNLLPVTRLHYIHIWKWAIAKSNWLVAFHIPAILNEEADYESRKNETSLEWKLNERIVISVLQHFKFTPDIELFSSRVKTQFPKFVSFRSDPEAIHVNASTIN